MISILAAHYGPVEDIEVLWTLIALIGAIFSAFNVRDAYHDMKALTYAAKINGRGKIARLFLKSEVARLIIQLIFLTVGALAMTITSPMETVGTPLNVLVLGVVIRWGLIVASALVSLKSYWAYQTRKDVLQDIDRELSAIMPYSNGISEGTHLSGEVNLVVKEDSPEPPTSPDSV